MFEKDRNISATTGFHMPMTGKAGIRSQTPAFRSISQIILKSFNKDGSILSICSTTLPKIVCHAIGLLYGFFMRVMMMQIE
ncbi:hypothetical protein B1B05_18435 [Domibacillus enclensis]|uniref:Uncharacterized protein n=1 Tax=Domibacillus enclensis TaxID=1017273 RepID=A0ABX4E4E4_9BACI|nr:hypothetical protein B1B05_18435 [Domibacillus enclensis]